MAAAEEILRLCASDDFSAVAFKEALSGNSESVDTPDKDGMTALMHCAFRGHLEGLRLLLERGANVNIQQPPDGYTPLMFATIAGRTSCVQELLAAGAKTSIENTIGKTATSLGSFVGQQSCVQILNSHISMGELELLTGKMGKEGQPFLGPASTKRLHTLVTIPSVHPVKIVRWLEGSELLSHSAKVLSVLETLAKQSLNNDKAELSIKSHYLAFLLQLIGRDSSALLKRLLSRTSSGVAEEMDKVLRGSLQSYPHTHSPLLQQLVKTLATTPLGGPPTALSLFQQAILGLRPSDGSAEECWTCGEQSEELKKCSQCKMVRYCGVECQKLSWTLGNHRKLCKPPKH